MPGAAAADGHVDKPGLRRNAPLDKLRGHDHVLGPGRHIHFPSQEDDSERFEDPMNHPAAQPLEQQAEGAQLDPTTEVKPPGAGI